MVMVLFFNPEDEVAIGVYEKTGPGNEYVPVHTAFGMVCIMYHLKFPHLLLIHFKTINPRNSFISDTTKTEIFGPF